MSDLSSNLNGLFITGTDTGVGKTVVTACLLAASRAAGLDAQALKPLVSGMAETPDSDWPHDHVLLSRVAQRRPEEVCFKSYGPAVSPHLAAELEGSQLDTTELKRWLAEKLTSSELTFVEGVGGLLVPLTIDLLVIDLAKQLELPLIVVARPELGTINHTLLTLKQADNAGLQVAAVVFSNWPKEPEPIHRSNRETVQKLTNIPVLTLPSLPNSENQTLAAAGAELLKTLDLS